MKKYNDIIVVFHIGRGGRFHNPGHIEYLPDIKSKQDLYGDLCIFDYDPESGEKLPVEQHILVDSGGNEVLRGMEIYENTDTLDFDGDFDSYHVFRLDEMPERYAAALANAVKDDKIDSDIRKEVVSCLSEQGYDIPALLMDADAKEIYEGLSAFVDEDDPIDPYSFGIEELDENREARLVKFEFEDIESCCLVYTDGTIFTPYDWQSGDYPKDMGEVEEYEWVDYRGMRTIMLGGLPRTPFWR